jgi:hypothetical protein
MSHATKSPRPVKPVSGSCRWLSAFDDRGTAVLEINGTAYTVQQLLGWPEGAEGSELVGYRLTNRESGKVYDLEVTAEPWRCDCPDFLHRRDGKDAKGCKHVAGLRAALQRIGAL